ncbi:hypothetical protein [Methanosarcina sp.]|uniref:hypothetical protein n=1 Tax=Methanosarcina sp. TaxID=2213 RepID=UPI003C774FF8
MSTACSEAVLSTAVYKRPSSFFDGHMGIFRTIFITVLAVKQTTTGTLGIIPVSSTTSTGALPDRAC